MFENHHNKCDDNVTMPKPSILIVDDDQSFAERLKHALEGLFQVETCHSEQAFRERYAIGRFDLIIMDMRLREDREGIDLLREIQAQDPTQAAIVMTAYADMESYADAIESGALTYLDKHEFSPTLIARTVEALAQQGALRKRVAALEQQLDWVDPLEIIGASAAIREMRTALQRAAEDGSAPVLITGEPGTGRQLVARNIHCLGRLRADGPFVAAYRYRHQGVVAGSQLFGTSHRLPEGRRQDSSGLLDEAKGGVLFLDEAHSLEEVTIRKLLRYLETGTFSRVGREDRIDTDMQLIFSTIPDRADDVAFTALQTALLDRHGGVLIRVPPLRERREDIPLIAQYTLQNLYRRGRTRTRSLRGAAITILEGLSWPGNVRELKGAMEYAAIRADAMGAGEIGPEHLPQGVLDASPRPRAIASVLDYQIHLARAELGLVESAIKTFEITKKGDLAARLHYNDRFTFARRIRRCLKSYPALGGEFPKTQGLFAGKREVGRVEPGAKTNAN